MAEKYGIAFHVTPYMLAMRYGGEWWRREKTRTETPPTEADWAEYREGVALLEKLRDNPYFEEGGPEYGASMEEPRPTVHVEYAETEDEWRARIATLDIDEAERNRPDFLRPFLDAVANRMTNPSITFTEEPK